MLASAAAGTSTGGQSLCCGAELVHYGCRHKRLCTWPHATHKGAAGLVVDAELHRCLLHGDTVACLHRCSLGNPIAMHEAPDRASRCVRTAPLQPLCLGTRQACIATAYCCFGCSAVQRAHEWCDRSALARILAAYVCVQPCEHETVAVPGHPPCPNGPHCWLVASCSLLYLMPGGLTSGVQQAKPLHPAMCCFAFTAAAVLHSKRWLYLASPHACCCTAQVTQSNQQCTYPNSMSKRLRS